MNADRTIGGLPACVLPPFVGGDSMSSLLTHLYQGRSRIDPYQSRDPLGGQR
jgi:hypothetical protein